MRIYKNIVYIAVTLFAIVSCDIKDDIPYPIVHGQITEFEVEGQCGPDGGSNYTTVIDKDAKQVTLYVCDTVNVANLRITKISVAGTTFNPDVDYKDAPALFPDSALCANYQKFPKQAFSKTDDGSDTRVNFTHPVRFVVRTYQDYEWTVTVNQVVNREIEVENQIGKAVIDPATQNAVVYVSINQSLKRLKVHKFTLGGQNGKVSPDPTKEDTYDFYTKKEFRVETGWGETQMWTVSVYQTEEEVSTSAHAFARNNSMTIYGDKPNGTVPVIEYKKASSSVWEVVPESRISTTSITYTTTVEGLEPATKYHYRVTADRKSVV